LVDQFVVAKKGMKSRVKDNLGIKLSRKYESVLKGKNHLTTQLKNSMIKIYCKKKAALRGFLVAGARFELTTWRTPELTLLHVQLAILV
jgi:hypothetical protein